MKKIKKEDIKQSIDELSDSSLERLHQFIKGLKNSHRDKKPLNPVHLGGKFDNINVRSKAYE
ncbi:hypothetical protein OAO01_04685 [Oligoflexia bacterium]|nr:hypothetical protein [Oligoflexia bacterium]